MARNVAQAPSQQSTANAQDIGYVLGKMEMLEKKFDEHRKESNSEMEEILTKLTDMADSMSFWKHTIWILKAAAASLPLILASNYDGLVQLWKDF